MRDADVVVLSRFPAIFEGFRESVDADAPEVDKIVVWDERSEVRPQEKWDHWTWSKVFQPFNIAANANWGWRLSETDNREIYPDIVYAGDDTRIIEPDTIKRLRNIAEIYPDVGILAPRIKGQDHDHFTTITTVPCVPFVFVLIKRELIDAIGYLDERFTGYGVEDLEYCVRARKAGFKIAYADGVHIQHGVDGQKWGSTFKRVKTEAQMFTEDAENWRRFAEKYGLPNDRQKCWDFIRGL